MSSIDATSWTLIQRAAAGHASDKESFARCYGPVLRSYLAARWRLPIDHERVEDCTQEIFVQCFKQGGALKRADPSHQGGFRAFLYGVARNVSAMAERARRQQNRKEVQESSSFALENVRSEDASLSQVFDRAWALMITREARELLARREGAAAPWLRALELRYQGHRPPREIARELGVEVNRVYEMLRKAKHEYRIALIEVMGTYHPDADESELEQRCIDLLASL